jgi:hypothetical protein
MSRTFSRLAGVTVLLTLLAGLPGITPSVFAATVASPSPALVQQAAAAGPKVVIVVGATEGTTPTYRADADLIYAEAIKYTSNVVKIYSPNATWAVVKAAAQGASIFVYLGHGYGFPSPYKPVLTPSVHDGMGLNIALNQGDSNKQYYGESFVGSEIRLAKNAIVILNHLCYSAGSSEAGAPEPTIPVAKERVDNFASGFLRAGARAVLADSWNAAPIGMIRALFTTHESIGTAWHGLSSAQGHDISWTPLRNPAYTAIMDPDTATTGFHRSIVGNLTMQTDEVLAGATVPPTNLDPATLQAPGAAATTAAIPLYTDATLATPSGTLLTTGARLRVAQVAAPVTPPGGSAPVPAVQVTALAGSPTGWVAGDGLAPRDSVGPQLWAMDGHTTVSPNFDGSDDTLNLLARFSEPVTWTARILDPSAAAVATFGGSGDSAILGWNPIVGGVLPPDGAYSWTIHAVDGWGNAALDASGPIHLVNAPMAPSAVASFVPITAATTNALSTTFRLTFGGPITGLSAADFTVTGSSYGCTVGAPVGSGASYTVSVSGCSPGKIVLTLEPGSVVDTLGGTGPAGAISAHWVLYDRTAPVVTAPKTAPRSGAALAGGLVPVLLSWSVSDAGGSGIRGYDVAQSSDGGVFVVIRSGLPGASLALSLAPGHSYRFEVRATDKASNRSPWVAGLSAIPSLVQQTGGVVYGGSWASVASATYSGGTAQSSGAAGAWASYTFTGRGIEAFLTRGPTRGQVSIYVDGVLISTPDLYAAAATGPVAVFVRAYPTSGAHTIKLVVVGTVGRPTIVLDAFGVIR